MADVSWADLQGMGSRSARKLRCRAGQVSLRDQLVRDGVLVGHAAARGYDFSSVAAGDARLAARKAPRPICNRQSIGTLQFKRHS